MIELSVIVGAGTLVVQGIVAVFIYYYQHSIKQDFDERIEALKGEISRKNISYQIEHTEFTKRRFDKIDSLFRLLYDTYKSLGFLTSYDFFTGKSFEFYYSELERLITTEIELRKQLDETVIFLNDELVDKFEEFINVYYYIGGYVTTKCDPDSMDIDKDTSIYNYLSKSDFIAIRKRFEESVPIFNFIKKNCSEILQASTKE